MRPRIVHGTTFREIGACGDWGGGGGVTNYWRTF